MSLRELRRFQAILLITITLILLSSSFTSLQTGSFVIETQPIKFISIQQEKQLKVVDQEFYAGGSPGISMAPNSDSTYLSSWEPAPKLFTSPAIGSRNVIVILIDFPDKTGTTNSSYFQTIIFGNAKGDLNNYLYEVSYNKFITDGAVAGSKWYKSSKNMSYWGADSGSGHDDANAYVFELTREALILADVEVNFRSFDLNHNNVTESDELGIFVVHSGPLKRHILGMELTSGLILGMFMVKVTWERMAHHFQTPS